MDEKANSLDSSFRILNDPWNYIEPEVLDEIISIYPEINKKTIFIVPATGISVLKIPVLVDGVCVVLKLKSLFVNQHIKIDYSYLLNFLMIQKSV